MSNLSSLQIVDMLIDDLLKEVCDGKVRKVAEVRAIQADIRRLEESRSWLLAARRPTLRSTLALWLWRLRSLVRGH